MKVSVHYLGSDEQMSIFNKHFSLYDEGSKSFKSILFFKFLISFFQKFKIAK